MKRLLAILTAAAVATTCVYHRVDVQSIDPGSMHDADITSPVKAHLKNGSTVMYSTGVHVGSGALSGRGEVYDVKLARTGMVQTVPLDQVVGLESFETRVKAGKTAVLTALASVGISVGTGALLLAIFGSCPTVYSDNGRVEEAELFSTSVAPLFEARDVDRLHAATDAAGRVRLEIRNEAMETHYLNHLQLLEVRHAANETVLPDGQGAPLVVSGVTPPASIVNREGRDVRSLVLRADGNAYRADRRAIDAVSAADMDDWLEFDVPAAPGATSATVVLRMRNSLLSTVMLYDVMLAPAGAYAIDWLGDSLSHISTAVELGRWHQRRAGLHVEVRRGGRYEEVVRIPDSGPISWHDVAAEIPLEPGQPATRVRLSSLTDHWRIDFVGIAAAARPAEPRTIAIAQVTGSHGEIERDALQRLSAADEEYLQTSPGQRFFATFEAGPSPGESRTFLLSSQGYYTEWIRGSWIQHATVQAPFAPSDQSLLVAMRKWAAERESFEHRFMTARVPVR